MHASTARSHLARSCILVVDRRASVRAAVTETLDRDGFQVLAVPDAASALQVLRGQDGGDHPALAIIDVAGRPADGLALLAEVRHLDESIPVILMAARDQDLDPAEGLELGADDFLVQPCTSRELLARVNGLLRRVHRATPADASPRVRPAPMLIGPPRESGASIGRTTERGRFGSLVIDRPAREVYLDGQLVRTTRREFDLLNCLASHPRRVFSREQLLRAAWASSAEWQVPSTVTEHIRRLRLKLERDPTHPHWLQTVRGVGYRFVP